jgi:hypothetical protein
VSKKRNSDRAGQSAATGSLAGRIAGVLAHAEAEAAATFIEALVQVEGICAAERLRQGDRLLPTAVNASAPAAGAQAQADALERRLAELRDQCEALATDLSRLGAGAQGPLLPVAPAARPQVPVEPAGRPQAPVEPAGRPQAPVEPTTRLSVRVEPVTLAPEVGANGTNGRGSRPGAGQAVPADQDLERTARLIALPMAVAGSSRVDVERHLRESLGLKDPTAVLDHVFGVSPLRR